MKSINVNLTREFWIEILETFKVFSSKESVFKYRLNKIIEKWEIHYIQYILLKYFNENIFNNYKLNFMKFNNRTYFIIDTQKFLKYSNKYKEFFNLKIEKNLININDLLVKYIKYIEENESLVLEKKELQEFILYYIYYKIWIKKSITNEVSLLKFVYPKEIILNNVKITIYNVKIINEILIILWKIISEYKIEEIIIIWEIFNSYSLNILKKYSLSFWVSINSTENLQNIKYEYNYKIFIMTNKNFNENYINYFSYYKNILILFNLFDEYKIEKNLYR